MICSVCSVEAAERLGARPETGIVPEGVTLIQAIIECMFLTSLVVSHMYMYKHMCVCVCVCVLQNTWIFSPMYYVSKGSE
jgi:hypothetical protein